jgi:hypothetical protein
VSTACCANNLPYTIHAQFQNTGGGACPFFDNQSFTLTYGYGVLNGYGANLGPPTPFSNGFILTLNCSTLQLTGIATADAGHTCGLQLICCVANGCILGTGNLNPNPGRTCVPFNWVFSNLLLCPSGTCHSCDAQPQYTITITA